jgi:hypothetical protein
MSQNIEIVASSKNGSRNIELVSGFRMRSLSLMAWKPRTDDPSKLTPRAKLPSSSDAAGNVMCCRPPKRSTNFISTNSISSSRILLRTSRTLMC